MEFLQRGDGILADDMGLGKMIQALMAMDAHGVAIVIAPKKVQVSWLDAIKVWRPDLVGVDGTEHINSPLNEHGMALAAGKRNGGRELYKMQPGAQAMESAVNKRFDRGTVVVTWCQALADGNHWDGTTRQAREAGPITVVLDEPHMHRTFTSKWTKRIASWTRWGTRVWALDGTPIYNTVEDIWPILCLCRLGTRFKLARVTSEALNGRLESELCKSGIMLRRTAHEVESDVRLPPLEKAVVSVPWIPISGAGLTAAKLRQRNGVVKTANVADWLRMGVLGVPLEGPGLIWCFHINAAGGALAALQGAGVRAAKVTGETSAGQSARTFAAFQASNLDWLVLTYSANAGPTLTRARHSVVLELPWEPKALAQATHRMWRIGQTQLTRETVVLFDHWSDEHVLRLTTHKALKINHAGF